MTSMTDWDNKEGSKKKEIVVSSHKNKNLAFNKYAV